MGNWGPLGNLVICITVCAPLDSRAGIIPGGAITLELLMPRTMA